MHKHQKFKLYYLLFFWKNLNHIRDFFRFLMYKKIFQPLKILFMDNPNLVVGPQKKWLDFKTLQGTGRFKKSANLVSPFFKMSSPAFAANGLLVATVPLRPRVTDLLEAYL